MNIKDLITVNNYLAQELAHYEHNPIGREMVEGLLLEMLSLGLDSPLPEQIQSLEDLRQALEAFTQTVQSHD